MNELTLKDSNERLSAVEKLRSAMINGDLRQLNDEDKLFYYSKLCESLGLNPMTKPFEYIVLNGKTVLYAKKDATDQLRSIHKISIPKLEGKIIGKDVYAVTAYGVTADGREDTSTGAVSIAGLSGDKYANAVMKAETKAKRRLTLSLAGLGFLDESEIETIPVNQKYLLTESLNKETGEIIKLEEENFDIETHKNYYLSKIQSASDEDELKSYYAEAYRSRLQEFPEVIKLITMAKDIRKKHIFESLLEETMHD